MSPGFFIRRHNNITAIIVLLLSLSGCYPLHDNQPKMKEVIVSGGEDGEMTPLVAEATRDGGNVLAGTNGMQFTAWALKMDGNGKVVWRFRRTIAENERSHPDPIKIEFNGLAQMPDNTVYLCGSIIDHQNTENTGLIDHIDEKGVLISEKLIGRPMGFGDSTSRLVLNSCTPDNDALMVIGSAYGSHPYFSIMKLDYRGQLLWEKGVNPLEVTERRSDHNFPNDIIYSIYPKQPLSFSLISGTHSNLTINNRITFIETDGVNSEFLSINEKGKILTRAARLGNIFFLNQINTRDIDLIYHGLGSFPETFYIEKFLSPPYINQAQYQTGQFGLIRSGISISYDHLVLLGQAESMRRDKSLIIYKTNNIGEKGNLTKFSILGGHGFLTNYVSSPIFGSSKFLVAAPFFHSDSLSEIFGRYQSGIDGLTLFYVDSATNYGEPL